MRVAVHNAPIEGRDGVPQTFRALFSGVLTHMHFTDALVDGRGAALSFRVQIAGYPGEAEGVNPMRFHDGKRSAPRAGAGPGVCQAARYALQPRMIEMLEPLVPDLPATVLGQEPAPLLEQVKTLRLENAALRAQSAALQTRIRDMEAWLGQNSWKSAWWLQTRRSCEAARRVSAPASMEGADRLHGT